MSIMMELRAGKSTILDGFLLQGCPEEEVRVGDYYVAQRNTGPQLLRAEAVDEVGWWIVPDTFAYVYDIGECVKVEILGTK